MDEQTTAQIRNPERFARKYKGQPWWVLILIATLPPLITAFFAGFFSYRAAVVESKMKAAESKRTAEAGYDALVKAVDTLQTREEESARTIAKLNGHIEAIEAWMHDMKPHVDKTTQETHLDLPVPSNAPNKKTWRPNFPPKVSAPMQALAPRRLPRSLDEAANLAASQ